MKPYDSVCGVNPCCGVGRTEPCDGGCTVEHSEVGAEWNPEKVDAQWSPAQVDIVWSRIAVDAEMQRSRFSPVPAVMMEIGCYLDIRNNPRLLQKSARENCCGSHGRDRDAPKLFGNGSVGDNNGNSLTSIAKLHPCLHTK